MGANMTALYFEGVYKDFHQLGIGKYKHVLFQEVIFRLYTATNTVNQQNLSNWLCVPLLNILDAQRRNIIPIKWLHALLLNGSAYNPYWVLTGNDSLEWPKFIKTYQGEYWSWAIMYDTILPRTM